MSCRLSEQPCESSEAGGGKLRTANDKLQVAHKTMYDLKCLGSSYASLIESEAVDSMEHILDLALSQQFLRKLFYGEVTNKANIITWNDVLSRPCLICLVARESTDNTSVMIFVTIPDIDGENGISV